MKKSRIVHYVNQFFGQIGGEEKADVGPSSVEGPLGPGRLLQTLLGESGEVVATVRCGDNYFGEEPDMAAQKVVALIEPWSPNALVAGPAFNAGRYGPACGRVCAEVQRALKIPAVTGMFFENPGVDLFRQSAWIVRTGDSAADMAVAMERMVRLLMKLTQDGSESLASAVEEGYFPRGLRRNVASDRPAAERAVSMLLAKLGGLEFQSEIPLPKLDRVPPAPPVSDLRSATLALVTDGGLIAHGNPDRMTTGRSERFTKVSIQGLDRLSPEGFQVHHFGFDTRYVNQDPDRLVPLDVARELEREGRIGKLHDVVYATAGAGTALANGRRIGQGIAAELKAAGVEAAILTST